ncbi:MAG: hypothetical protein A2297_08660 [Elusimicrobia bacterium RIFOXYB2_FULL_48_7]|nr:MAG: hypothetical protein A2297_08660 [Elusimicrobia bacterium RIFOXYB2_FULL_48_7]
MNEQQVKECITSIISGNTDSYRFLVEEYKDSVYNLVFKFCGNFSDAEDITSEAFVRAYKNLHSYKPGMSFRNWLFSIAVNLARDILRKKKFKPGSLDVTMLLEESDVNIQFSDDADNPEEIVFNKEEKSALLGAIHALPEKYRVVIILRYMENMSFDEISVLLQKPLNSIKTWVSRAQKILSKKLGKV